MFATRCSPRRRECLGAHYRRSRSLHRRRPFSDPPRPLLQTLQQLSDQLLSGFIGEISAGVELLVGLGDHHFGQIQRMHV
jgi:hypothetical protein